MKVLTLLSSLLLGFTQGQNDVTFTGFINSVNNYVVGMDAHGDISAQCWFGMTGSLYPGNTKSEVRIYQMTQGGSTSLLATIADPLDGTYSTTSYDKFCLGLKMDDQYIYVPSPGQKKIYIYDYSSPASPTLDYTWDGSGITVDNYWPKIYWNGKINAIDVDKQGGTHTIVACGDKNYCSVLDKRLGYWSGGSNIQVIQSTAGSANTVAVSHGGGYFVACYTNDGCAFGRIKDSSLDSISTAQYDYTFGTSGYANSAAIKANAADPINNAPDYWIVGGNKKVYSHTWAQMDNSGFQESCGTTKGGGKFILIDGALDQLMVGHNTGTPLSNEGRCILDVSSSNKATYSILFQFDVSNSPYVPPQTGYAGGFGSTVMAFQGNSLLASTSHSTNENLKQGIYTAYNNVDQPPTPPPTLAPTKAPTFECYSSSTCGDNEYCAGATQTCEQTACASHLACDGFFMSGRLARCGDSGFCEDAFEGTCTNAVDCENKNLLKVAARDSVGVLTQQLTLTNITLAREVISSLKAATSANSTIGQNITFKISGTEKVYLEQSLFTQRSDQVILDAVAEVVCGVTGKDVVSISQVNGPSSRRVLQSAGEIEVTVTYEVVDVIYDTFPNGSFDSATFAASLEAALSLGAGNVTVTDVDGSVSITYFVTNEAPGDDPLSEDNFDELNDLKAELAIIESTIQTEFGLNGADLSAASIDKCGDRDCNGRGTCNAKTGVCLCDSTDYWGVNCETSVECTSGVNVGLNGQAYCECPYPNSGQRCTITNTCDGCT